MIKKGLLISAIVLGSIVANAQQVGSSPAYIKALTSEWKGERFPDGRPKVSDTLLERLKNISIEEAWGVLRNKGFHNPRRSNDRSRSYSAVHAIETRF